jgi:2-hydroxychromene-2-carboxylate isomerase
LTKPGLLVNATANGAAPGSRSTAVYDAIWVRALNMNDPEVAAQAFAAAGFDPAAIAALTDDPAVKAALKATTDEAVQRGVFGAPTMFVGDEMFFGQDRLDFVRESLATSPNA